MRHLGNTDIESLANGVLTRPILHINFCSGQNDLRTGSNYVHSAQSSNAPGKLLPGSQQIPGKEEILMQSPRSRLDNQGLRELIYMSFPEGLKVANPSGPREPGPYSGPKISDQAIS